MHDREVGRLPMHRLVVGVGALREGDGRPGSHRGV